jgi:pimeloyl-ACP methyl ester carboxylesterase
MGIVRVNGIDLHYVEAGSGEPLLLIMGLGGDHQAWGFQFRAFAERHRVIAFDNRGAGQSSAPDEPYTIRGMADDARGLLDALGVGRVHVVGVSMGGMIAQELALAQPERVASLHLGCTLARSDPYLRSVLRVWRDLRARLPQESVVRTIALWLLAPATFAERPDFAEMVVQAALANPFPQSTAGFLRQSEAVMGHDTLDRLAALRPPTLVTVGEDDILVPPRFSREVSAAIPGSALHVVAAAGHVYFWERVDDFNKLTLDFAAAHPA